MTRAAIYCRVSTDEQEKHGTSLDGQEAACQKYCTDRGYEIAVVEKEAFTGTLLEERQQLGRLRERVRAGQIDVIVAYEEDRLTRDQFHGYRLLDEVNQHGGRLETVLRGPIECNAYGVLRFSISMFGASDHREQMLRRTRDGKRRLIEKGAAPVWTCNLYGYVTDYTARTRSIQEHEAETVRQVYDRVLQGYSLESTFHWLNDRGVPSPGTRTMTYEDGRTPNWCSKAIRDMIRNPAYKGWTVHGRTELKDKRRNSTRKIKPESEWTITDKTGTVTPAIVSETDWDRANERLAANRGQAHRNEQRPVLLRGRVVCAHCGSPMYLDTSKDPSRKLRYRCRSRKRKHDCHYRSCPATNNILSGTLEAQVWSAVVDTLNRRETVVAEIRQRLDKPADLSMQQDHDRLSREIETLERRMARLLDLHIDGGIERSAYDAKRAAVQDEINRATERRNELGKALARSNGELVQVHPLDAIAQQVEEADGDIETRVRVLQELGVRVIASKRVSWLTWELPLPTGTECDLVLWVDFTGVEEPTEEQREEAWRFDMAEQHGAIEVEESGVQQSYPRAGVWGAPGV